MRNLYLVTRTDVASYGEYDALVVCAETEEQARNTHPAYLGWADGDGRGGWVAHDSVSRLLKVEHIGVATEPATRGVVLASFNAG